ncbi:hypothetical protein BYT27DRAFT_6592042 [Phlegmacium glaucopus]|nr:hypothetical protein BYT27DRAFT_6592042 [Phlegmacium glaucopus]
MSLSPELSSGYPGGARRSVSSISSSTSHHNSSSECTIQVEEDYKKSDGFSTTVPPLLPLSGKFNPHLIEHPVSHPSQSPLTTISQLAHALGPDNIPHTTEIETVPCAGIRIPYGPLTGLLAWRLVVRLASSTKEKRGWWNNKTDRRNSYDVSPVQNSRSHTQPYTEVPISVNSSPSSSARSLPLFPHSLSPRTGTPIDFSQKLRPISVGLTRQPHVSYKTHSQTINRSQPQLDQTSLSLSNAIAVNFILDTSLPHSIISRDTLIALGYPSSIFHLASIPHDDEPAMITLSIQNIPTRFHIARPGEASRLGVQFLHDAGVSVFFPKDGEGVGPVLYVESARLLQDVPRTIPFRGIGAKLTLPQRVRALLGLTNNHMHFKSGQT